jgi:hypothetical protein
VIETIIDGLVGGVNGAQKGIGQSTFDTRRQTFSDGKLSLTEYCDFIGDFAIAAMVVCDVDG